MGGGGFIGAHMVRRLKAEGLSVRAVDLKYPEYSRSAADEFIVADLRENSACMSALSSGPDRQFDEVYQFAADMGGAGYIFTGENDADVMSNSSLININVLTACRTHPPGRLMFSSSACIYPRGNQQSLDSPVTAEGSAYPADPDSNYGWEKLYAERLFAAFGENLDIPVRIARLHNIFGPEGAWRGGREKAPAAICRKVAEAVDGDAIEIWGDGRQTRSFLYIDECLDGLIRLMRSNWSEPVNIGSEEMVSINDLAHMVIRVAGKDLDLRHVPGPQGVRGRSSDNHLVREVLGWSPGQPLEAGLARTYAWIKSQVDATTELASPGRPRQAS